MSRPSGFVRQERATATTRRFRFFTTGGIISETGGRTTLRLSVPPAERDWWWAVLEKILSVCPNCNPVSPRAPCQSEKGRRPHLSPCSRPLRCSRPLPCSRRLC
jgi:hypothetical protein